MMYFEYFPLYVETHDKHSDMSFTPSIIGSDRVHKLVLFFAKQNKKRAAVQTTEEEVPCSKSPVSI